MGQTKNRVELDRTKLLGFRLDANSSDKIANSKSSAKMGAKFGSKLGGKPGQKPVQGAVKV